MLDKEGNPDWVKIFLWLAAAIAVATVLMMWSLGMGPFVRQYETETLRQSEQYRSSAETMLLDSMQSWYDLDTKAIEYAGHDEIVAGYRNQQAALLRRMNTKAGKLQENQIPESVREFLREHNSNGGK